MSPAQITQSVIETFFDEFGFSKPGALFMWVIVVVAAVSLAIFLERVYIVIFKSKVNTRKFMTEIIRLIRAKKFDQALALCDAAPESAIPFIAKAGILQADRGVRAVQNAMDEASLSVIPKVQKRIPYLSVLANISTLSGLMGTIFGLMYSFKSISVLSPSEQASALATGISAAMNTTLFGLFVAIPTTIAYAWLSSQATNLVDDLDEQSVRLINTLSEI